MQNQDMDLLLIERKSKFTMKEMIRNVKQMLQKQREHGI